jgi:hypothetical protein
MAARAFVLSKNYKNTSPLTSKADTDPSRDMLALNFSTTSIDTAALRGLTLTSYCSFS